MNSILVNPTYGKIFDKLVNHTVFADLNLKSNRHRAFWIEFGRPAFTLGMIKNTFFRGTFHADLGPHGIPSAVIAYES